MENPLADVTRRLMLPLVCGGELCPVAPIGPKRAREHAQTLAALPDFSGEVENEIQWQRLRIARRWCAVDRVPSPGYGEWLLIAALNDLLQATNPDLPGMFARERPARLVELAQEIVLTAGAPRTVGEALWRHATFSRLFELVRIDTHISWWVGSRTFRGSKPPPRLLAWQKVRRVRHHQDEIGLGAMVEEASTWVDAWRDLLARLVAATPLTDLASILRPMPKFAWTGATLGLISTRPGRTLARRALLRSGPGARVQTSLAEATQALAATEPRAAKLAKLFVEELVTNDGAARGAHESAAEHRAAPPSSESLR